MNEMKDINEMNEMNELDMLFLNLFILQKKFYCFHELIQDLLI